MVLLQYMWGNKKNVSISNIEKEDHQLFSSTDALVILPDERDDNEVLAHDDD